MFVRHFCKLVFCFLTIFPRATEKCPCWVSLRSYRVTCVSFFFLPWQDIPPVIPHSSFVWTVLGDRSRIVPVPRCPNHKNAPTVAAQPAHFIDTLERTAPAGTELVYLILPVPITPSVVEDVGHLDSVIPQSTSSAWSNCICNGGLYHLAIPM